MEARASQPPRPPSLVPQRPPAPEVTSPLRGSARVKSRRDPMPAARGPTRRRARSAAIATRGACASASRAGTSSRHRARRRRCPSPRRPVRPARKGSSVPPAPAPPRDVVVQTIRPPAPEPHPATTQSPIAPARVVDLGAPALRGDASPLPALPRRHRPDVAVLPLLRRLPRRRSVDRAGAAHARRRRRPRSRRPPVERLRAADARAAGAHASVADARAIDRRHALTRRGSGGARAPRAHRARRRRGARATRSARPPTSAAPRATSSSPTTATSRRATRASGCAAARTTCATSRARTASSCASPSRRERRGRRCEGSDRSRLDCRPSSSLSWIKTCSWWDNRC